MKNTLIDNMGISMKKLTVLIILLVNILALQAFNTYNNKDKFDYVGKISDAGIAIVRQNNKYGFVDANNRIIIPIIYDYIYPTKTWFDNNIRVQIEGLVWNAEIQYMTVKINGKWGTIDREGHQIVPIQYDDIEKATNESYIAGTMMVRKNGKWGLINSKGEVLTEFVYDSTPSISSSLGMREVSRNSKTVVLDKCGNEYESRMEYNQKADSILAYQGHPEFQCEYGCKLYYKEEYDKAIIWLRKALEAGYNPAGFPLGKIYYYGLGSTKQSFSKAIELFKITAESKKGCSCLVFLYLGEIYENGYGVPKDLAEAKKWYKIGEARGDVGSAERLKSLSDVNPSPLNINLASMTWLNTESAVSSKEYNLKVGVKSNSNITDRRIFLNGSEVSEFDKSPNNGTVDGYIMTINKQLTLVPGENKIKVEVTNADGTATIERTVTYNVKQQPVVNKERRIALVMGNAKYQDMDIRDLYNSVNDAIDVTSKLESLGFKVICGLNLTGRQMQDSIAKFGRLAANCDAALFYYSGHGVSCDGDNYIMPVNAHLPSKSFIKDNCINANSVLREMDNANCKMKIVILDACRNNPITKGWYKGTEEVGLCKMSSPTGTLIAYATHPGHVALDGKLGDRNSPYTSVLLKILNIPNLSINDFFQEVLERVASNTNGEQVPYTEGAVIGGKNFFFNKK